MKAFSPSDEAHARIALAAVTGWATSVAFASATGALARLAPTTVAPLIVAGIAIPSTIYIRTPGLRALARTIGVRAITFGHAWRIAAAFVFFAYDRRGKLPPLFARTAGWGDLAAGALALSLLALPRTRRTYLAVNAFGFVDFVSALATGLRLTRRRDPRMRAIARFPLALIPLFGVGLSGTAHLIAFDLLRTSDDARVAKPGSAGEKPITRSQPGADARI